MYSTEVFSEHVNGFTGSDVTLGGSANHNSATVTLTPGSGNSYRSEERRLGKDCTVTASTDADTVTDDAGNTNNGSTSSDNTVTYYTQGPAVTINQPSGQAKSDNT